jgi:uncharacterized DUF497 family protein
LEKENAWTFEWDEANVAHTARHDVNPLEVENAFRNGLMELDYEEVGGEPRWTSLGHTNDLRVITLIWTVRASAVRPITAKGRYPFWCARLLGKEANLDD